MAKKKDPTVLRLCIDFRELTNQTIPDSFTLPRIGDTVTRLGPAIYFTTIDIWNAFWQVGLLEADRPRTAYFYLSRPLPMEKDAFWCLQCRRNFPKDDDQSAPEYPPK